jgi:hypothetical protein
MGNCEIKLLEFPSPFVALVTHSNEENGGDQFRG